MSEPFIAEIRIFAGTFAPRNWSLCNGQILSIAQNTALFSLLGTTFGGDGRTTFALPNFQGAVPLGPGQGPGLPDYVLGEVGGAPTITLGVTQLPAHTHVPACLSTSPNPAPQLSPQGNVWGVAGSRRVPASLYKAAVGTAAQMNVQAIGAAGGSQPHNNMQPYLGVNFVIALQGIFPSRN